MTEEAIKKLTEQLSCPICLDTYSGPKQLQCHHIFCQKCLVQLAVRDQQGQLTLTCPMCCQVTPIPVGGTTGLKAALHVEKLLEIQASLNKIMAPSEDVEGNSGNKESSYCLLHDDKELELYCETCGELICFKCIMKGHRHADHEYDMIGKAFERYKEEMSSAIVPIEKKLIIIHEALTQLSSWSFAL